MPWRKQPPELCSTATPRQGFITEVLGGVLLKLRTGHRNIFINDTSDSLLGNTGHWQGCDTVMPKLCIRKTDLYFSKVKMATESSLIFKNSDQNHIVTVTKITVPCPPLPCETSNSSIYQWWRVLYLLILSTKKMLFPNLFYNNLQKFFLLLTWNFNSS